MSSSPAAIGSSDRSATQISKPAAVQSVDRRRSLRSTCDVRDPESVASLFAVVEASASAESTFWSTTPASAAGTDRRGDSLEAVARRDRHQPHRRLSLHARSAAADEGGRNHHQQSVGRGEAGVSQLSPPTTQPRRGALGFTLSLREELIPRGIRVMALMPGATATDMWQQIMPDAPRERMIDVESVAQAVLYAVLLPPNANLSEIAWIRLRGAVAAAIRIRYVGTEARNSCGSRQSAR